ncbi:MAG: radical SAM protein [Thermodesulfobacteriota bacterium]
MSKYWHIASPITVHVEITDACNERCRHCYNFSRLDSVKSRSISWENLDRTIDELIKNKVMHVIITGGEPLLALDRAVYLARKSLAAGMTVSLNSNLVGANAENMTALKEVGIDHILTTLHSWKEDVHDYIATTPGAFKKVINGIKAAQDNGIRVSVNTILFEFNKDDIYETGKLVHSLGINKFLANRTIPSPTNDESCKSEFHVGVPEATKMFEDLMRLKKEFGMQVGTCRTIPQCFFDELDAYDEFLGRGCSAGKKHFALGIDGDSHACVHESKDYGNIHEVGIKGIWKNMAVWRTLDYIPQGCQDCHLFDICDGGCRLVAIEHDSSISGYDNLRRGAEHLPEYNGGIKPEHIDAAKNKTFTIHPGFNYRKEDGFYIVRTVGARVDFIDNDICDTLINHHKSKLPLKLADIGEENLEKLAYYLKRDLVLTTT